MRTSRETGNTARKRFIIEIKVTVFKDSVDYTLHKWALEFVARPRGNVVLLKMLIFLRILANLLLLFVRKRQSLLRASIVVKRS